MTKPKRAAAAAPAVSFPRLIKIGVDGAELVADAAKWVAVLDQRTGLMWVVEPIKVKNWKAPTVKTTESIVATPKTAGYEDWRIPTVDELFTLADRTRTTSPAIDIDYFPDCPSDWFWTSTSYAPSPGGYAWFVSFGDGYASWYDRVNDGFVRAVRAGQ